MVGYKDSLKVRKIQILCWTIGQHRLDDGDGVRFVVADQAVGAAFGPADDIFVRLGLARLRIDDAPRDMVEGMV